MRYPIATGDGRMVDPRIGHVIWDRVNGKYCTRDDEHYDLIGNVRHHAFSIPSRFMGIENAD